VRSQVAALPDGITRIGFVETPWQWGATNFAIGDEFGISRERVRQIEVRVKKRFADFLRQQVPDIKDIEFGA